MFHIYVRHVFKPFMVTIINSLLRLTALSGGFKDKLISIIRVLIWDFTKWLCWDMCNSKRYLPQHSSLTTCASFHFMPVILRYTLKNCVTSSISAYPSVTIYLNSSKKMQCLGTVEASPHSSQTLKCFTLQSNMKN
jgi:hypothetical protein